MEPFIEKQLIIKKNVLEKLKKDGEPTFISIHKFLTKVF
jgi:hypothetical protein